MSAVEQLEKARCQLQAQLRGAKEQSLRNRLGQFATPPHLASEIVNFALSLLPRGRRVRFLEPGFGTGPFYSALLDSVRPARIERAAGYEIDPGYFEPNKQLWKGTGLQLHLADFTQVPPPRTDTLKYNLVVCNPPYVRHHHLSQAQKRKLQAVVARKLDFEMNGLSGLYAYFMVLSQAWMSKEGVGAWLVPSEFMDVNYGRKVKEFLTGRVTLHRIHRFDPNEVQFEDALVSSAVVCFTNSLPPDGHTVEFSFGGTLDKPKISASIELSRLCRISKWTRLPQTQPRPGRERNASTLADLFTVKRGLATGSNSFFVLSPEQVQEQAIPARFLQPILPSPRHLDTKEVLADENGEPLIEKQRYLLSSDLPESNIRTEHPSLWKYLQQGVEEKVRERYLCRHRQPWYSQENRPPAPFLCTYMGRASRGNESPFRFILNHSRATAPNVYLMLYPKPPLAKLLADTAGLSKVVHEALSSIPAEMLIGEGRIYGGGLHKLEPKELANVRADIVLNSFPEGSGVRLQRQLPLFTT